ncbi:MAG: glycoside hydrolase family 92 protein, partial [Cytophagales bacterium]|nr:glycoside hydrolase family 92 protein [Armatimonadota bacterium]
ASGAFVSDRRIEGQASFESDFGKFPHTVFFAAEFSRPVVQRSVWLGDEVRTGTDSIQSTRGQRSGLIATFAPGGPVEARVGISFQSVANARKHLAPTLGRPFEALVKDSQQAWRKALSKIEVAGGTETQQRQFYSALYHTQLMPTDHTNDFDLWPTREPHFDDIHAVWDTFRCTYALDTLIAPDTLRRILRSQLDIYKNKGWLPDYWRGHKYNIVQGGTNMDVVIADALVKGLGGFDSALAYEAIRKDATVPSPATSNWTLSGRHGVYFSLGYLPATSLKEIKFRTPVSTSLEYAYNDFCVAQAAQVLGKTADAQKFLAQSDNTWKLFDPETKFFWAKNDKGEWLSGFDPDRYAGGNGLFYEGTAWGYRFYAPHDMAGLIQRQGGAQSFVAALDAYFEGGKHNPGNEPNFLTPWLYNYAGRPDKTVDRVHAQLARDYRLAPAAYQGDDDSGAMSAWYVFSAMGFYPVTGQDLYLIGSPLFTSVRITLEKNRAFTLTARGQSPENRYVQSATLNGRPWNQAWLRHAEIAKGGDLVLVMGPRPSSWGTSALPPSRLLAQPSVPVATVP